ncbi:MAG: DMT family transporter [Desulfobulbus sp.]|nr:DMT family transporter [Desulfobulbus sp.]
MPLPERPTPAPIAPGASRRLHLLGWLAVFGSALFFYLATAIISWGQPHVAITAPFYVFARFLLGFVIVSLGMGLRRQRPVCTQLHYIIGRTVTNAVAVYCFYRAVEVSSVVSANILNMTYPLFVALASWFLLRDQRDRFALLVVAAAMVGVWLILDPTHIHGGWHNLWGLASGLTAGSSIIYLNLSRQHHDSQSILFFMFGPGALLMLSFFHEALFWPNAVEWGFLLACSISGILGQYCLTYGFLYVTAVEGAVVSSSRILMAALLGPLLVADPPLTLVGWTGALIIFAANITLALRRPAVIR